MRLNIQILTYIQKTMSTMRYLDKPSPDLQNTRNKFRYTDKQL